MPHSYDREQYVVREAALPVIKSFTTPLGKLVVHEQQTAGEWLSGDPVEVSR